MIKTIASVCFLIVVVLFSSCDFHKEPIPAYLYIDNFSFSDGPGQGYPSSKITDGWVYENGEVVGVFSLPGTIPVLTEGMTDILILPGIKENGISGTGINYPFYTSYSSTDNLQAGETDTLHPSCTYIAAGIHFLWLEDFNSGNDMLPGNNTDTDWVLVYDTSIVFEGTRCIGAFLDDAHPYFDGTTGDLTLPAPGATLFLEMDYENNMAFDVYVTGIYFGATSSSASVYALTISPKESWNKIYINLSDELQNLNADSYKIEFRASKPSGETGTLFIDNMKLISSEGV